MAIERLKQEAQINQNNLNFLVLTWIKKITKNLPDI
jgi:hypothetical protein